MKQARFHLFDEQYQSYIDIPVRLDDSVVDTLKTYVPPNRRGELRLNF